MQHCLIVEDHHIMNKGLEYVLKSAFRDIKISTATNINSAAYHLASHKDIELMITDLELEKGDWAIELIKAVRVSKNRVRIIVYSKYEEKGLLNQALKAGANAYLSKHATEQEVLDCIRQVMKQGRFISASEVKINDQIARVIETSFLTPEEKYRNLTEREKEVAHLLFKDFSRKEIADKLFLGQETIKTHSRHIYEKLEIDSKAKLQVFFKVNHHLLT